MDSSEQGNIEEQNYSKIKKFLDDTNKFPDSFYDSLLKSDAKKPSILLKKLFFYQASANKNNSVKSDVQKSNQELLNGLNNGMIYTFIFDYIGSSQEFEQFSILRSRQSKEQAKNSIKEIEYFVYSPDNEQKYHQIKNEMRWKDHFRVRITDDSSMAVCLNDAMLKQEWQLQFQENLLSWLEDDKFSPGQSIGLGYNIGQSLKQIHSQLKIKKEVIWIFQIQLARYLQMKDNGIFLDGSGNGALIRSAGLFQQYIVLYRAFKNLNITNEQLTKEFEDRITLIYMMDQHDQSSLTHSGLQAQVCILLLGYIQIKLLIQQLGYEERPDKKSLKEAVQELFCSFVSDHLEKILNSYMKTDIKLSQFDDYIRKIEKQKKPDQRYPWKQYLNVNTYLRDQSSTDQIFKSLLIFYYQLFYKNEDGHYMWEDNNFIEYLAQKREYKREGENLDLENPAANSYTKLNKEEFADDRSYDIYLHNCNTGYFASYAPDCMSLIFNLINSSDSQKNTDIFDFLFDICLKKGDCDSYGAVLATIIAAYDFNYHDNYKAPNQLGEERNNFMTHLERQDLKKCDFIYDLKRQIDEQYSQLQNGFK